MRFQARRLTVAAAAVTGGIGLAAAGSALLIAGPVGAATTCEAAQTITGNAQALLIKPPIATMGVGQCDTFTNNANAAVTVTVSQTGTAYREVINPGSTANYTTTELGKHTITATELFASAPGKLTVEQAKTTSTPTSATTSPTTSTSTSAAAPTTSAVTSTTAARARHRRRHHNGATTVPSLTVPPGETASPYTVQRSAGGSSPQVAGAPPTSAPATTTLSPTANGARPGSVTPVKVAGKSWNLLLAVAALLAFGQFLALGRVLLTVDKRRRGVGPRA